MLRVFGEEVTLPGGDTVQGIWLTDIGVDIDLGIDVVREKNTLLVYGPRDGGIAAATDIVVDGRQFLVTNVLPLPYSLWRVAHLNPRPT